MDSNENDKRRELIAKNLGNTLLKLRKKRGYTREQLAEKSNLSANYIYGLENGAYLPGYIALIDLANALNVTTSQLTEQDISNKQNIFLEQFSRELDILSKRDLDLLLNIINFLKDEKK